MADSVAPVALEAMVTWIRATGETNSGGNPQRSEGAAAFSTWGRPVAYSKESSDADGAPVLVAATCSGQQSDRAHPC